MPRKRVTNRVHWRLNLTLYVGIHDDLIALKAATPAGRQAQVVIDAMRNGRAAQSAPVEDEQALEDDLTNLL